MIFLLVAIGMAVLPAGCSFGSSTSGSSGGDEPTPTPIPTSIVPTNPTYTVERGLVVDEMQFTARIAPVVEEELFFKMGGYVDTVYVRRGDEVKEGDLLAELEVTDLKNQITQKEAELQAVQMDFDRRMAEAQANVHSKELSLAILQSSLSQAQLVSARQNLERAQERLADAQVEYAESLEREWEKEEVRERYADAVNAAEDNLELVRAQYQDVINVRTRNEYQIELAQQDLDLTMMRLNEIEVGLDVTRTVLSLQRLKDQLNDARVVAPFDGVLLLTSIIEGKQIQGYKPVMTLADTTELEVSAELLDSEMSLLAEGMEVVAEFVNRPGQETKGVIRRLPYPYGSTKPTEGVDDEDKSVRITLLDANQEDLGFDVGDRLRITVELDRSEDTLFLPPQAVRTFEGRNFVVVQEGGGQRRVDVTVGIRATDRIEILDGLEEGQTVVAP